MPWTAILAGIAALLLAVALAMRLAQRALLRSRPRGEPASFPPVSILKPVKGVDRNLRENLESFYRLDYQEYEIVIGAREADDPGLAMAREVAGAHPQVRTTFVARDRDAAPNPKVSNLANMLPEARHDLILISDSNVAASPGYLRGLVAYLAEPGVALVTSPFRGVGGRGLGGALMGYYLNTYIMSGTACLDRVLGMTCTVGKSMLLGREDLKRIGGFEHLGRYLAEDQILGEDLVAAGRKVHLGHEPVDHPLGRTSVREFAMRHLRWAMLRRHMSPIGYFGEQLLNPVFTVGVGAALIASLPALGVFGATWLTVSALGLWSDRMLSIRRPLWSYPVLELLRSFITALLWPVPFLYARVSWRGNRFRLGRRTLLQRESSP